ncbi:SDR family NAD(P)-dependent oxidoreductase [Chloroflexota bacterium]
MELKGKVGIIIGGAGGIGRATSLRLAKEGCQVVVASRDYDKVKAVAQEVEDSGNTALGIEVDVTSLESVKQLVKSTIDKFGTIHILVNSMASPIFGSFLELPDESWQEVLAVKYLGSVRSMREVLPYMIRQKYGRVVNVSGSAGKEPTPVHLPGGSMNAAINQFTKGLAREMGKHNIRINAVSPSLTATERAIQLAKIRAAERQIDIQTLREEDAKEVPLGRMGEPEEIAEVIAFLVSDRSSYINGACIMVDGGRTRSV